MILASGLQLLIRARDTEDFQFAIKQLGGHVDVGGSIEHNHLHIVIKEIAGEPDVDGGFDLFSSGHIAFLQKVDELETRLGQERGWYTDEARAQRMSEHGEDYGPAYVIGGVHDDEVINFYKGMNYPIMNVYERGLCVVQCRYVHSVVFGAPYAPTKAYLEGLPATGGKLPDVIYHGPTNFMPGNQAPIPQPDPFTDAKSLGIFKETPAHDFQNVNSAQIVKRILDNRAEYEERQRKKGQKGVGEEAQRKKELEKEKAKVKAMQLKRQQSEIERQFGA